MKLTLFAAEDRVREMHFTKTGFYRGLQHTLQTCLYDYTMTSPEHCVASLTFLLFGFRAPRSGRANAL